MSGMDNFKRIFEVTVMEVEAWRIILLFGAIAGGWIGGRILAIVLGNAGVRLAANGRELTANFLQSLARSITLPAMLLGIQFGVAFLPMPGELETLVFDILRILMVVAIGLVLYRLVDVPSHLYRRWSAQQESKLTEMLGPILESSLRAAVIILTLVQAAQVLSDKPITSIIAGLGIGGLALALASQDSLKHFFGSVVIFADRPFEVGDRLDVDGFDGIVDRVGFRSTRLRTLDGHMVTIPNGELANKSIRNISKRPFIRRIADITITYDTPPEKIEQALAILKELLANHEGMHADLPPRVFFSDFNADSLNLKVIYWYHPPLYWDYMAFSERFNMEVFTRFNQAGIDFAFPTQTIHLAGDDRRPLHIGVHRHPAD